MKITEIKIRKTYTEGRLRAIASIIFDDCVAIHDIKIIDGLDRKFVAMPSRKESNGNFRDIVHPINHETRTQIEEAILEEYDRVLLESSEEVSI